MLLIIEIALTAAAWSRGWRGRALIPMASVFILAFLIGAMAGASGMTQNDIQALSVSLVFLDFICIGVLGWMAAKGRETEASEADEILEQPSSLTKPVQ